MRHCCLSLLSGALEEERWRDAGKERWKKKIKRQGREERVQGQADLWVSVSESCHLWGLCRDAPIWSSVLTHTYTHREHAHTVDTRAACGCATSHPTGKTLKVVIAAGGESFYVWGNDGVSVHVLLSVADGEINEQSSSSNTIWNLDWKRSTAISTDWDRSLGGVEEEKQRWRERQSCWEITEQRERGTECDGEEWQVLVWAEIHSFWVLMGAIEGKKKE